MLLLSEKGKRTYYPWFQASIGGHETYALGKWGNDCMHIFPINSCFPNKKKERETFLFVTKCINLINSKLLQLIGICCLCILHSILFNICARHSTKHFILSNSLTTLWGGGCDYPHFKDEETEEQIRKFTPNHKADCQVWHWILPYL